MIYVRFLRAVKDSSSILLKHMIQNQEQHNNISLETLYTLKLDLSLFTTDDVYFLPSGENSTICCTLERRFSPKCNT